MHLSDKGMWLMQALFVPLLILAAPVTGRINLTLSFFQALAHIGTLRQARQEARATRRLSEREVMDRIMATPLSSEPNHHNPVS